MRLGPGGRGAAGLGRPAGVSAITVTWRTLPGWYGAAISTPTSTVCRAPWPRPLITAGNGVLTPGPSTLTARPASAARPEPSPATVTRMI